MPSHYGPKTTTDSLVVRLDPADKNSYPGSGTTVTDLTGNGHHGQLTTAPTFSTLASGCFDHAADTGQVVRIDGNVVFRSAKSWEIWFNPDTIPASSTFDSIFQCSQNWNGTTGISMQMIYGNLTWSWGSTWGGTCSISLSNLTAGSWHHAVGTTDGTTGTDKGKLYLNGVLRDTGTSAAIPNTYTPNVKIGDGNGGNIDGKTSCFSVYSKELSADEVYANYIALKSRFE